MKKDININEQKKGLFSRRGFINRGLKTGTGLAFSGMIINGSLKKIYGINKIFKYDPDWPQKDVPSIKARGIDADNKGNIYFTGDAEHPVVIYTPEGKFSGSWGKGILPAAHGLRIHNDTVWVSDVKNHQVHQFTLAGKEVRSFGTKGQAGDAPEQFNKPTDFAFSKKDDIYISDGYVNTRVVCYNQNGTIKKIWGNKGSGKSEFKLVHAIEICSDNRVYVGDRNNSRIQVFDPDGNYFTEWNHIGKPFGLCASNESTIFICGIAPGGGKIRVLHCDLEGKVLSEFGDKGEGPGQFLQAHSIYVDKTGRIYVADGKANRVQRFLPT